MAKPKIDIRKLTDMGAEYYQSVDSDDVFFTHTGRLRGITEFGRSVLGSKEVFGRMFRTLVSYTVKGQPIDKKKFGAVFGLPGRMFNLALEKAKGMVQGTRASQKTALEDTEDEIQRCVVDVFYCDRNERPGKVKHLLKLYRKRNRLKKLAGKPVKIHFGRKHYHATVDDSWKKAYDAERNDRLGSMGSADESGGNSTFSIKHVEENGKSYFTVSHAGQKVADFRLKRKEAAVLAAILAVNWVPFKFRTVIAAQGPNKGKPVQRKITTGRVALTVWLLQNEQGKWKIQISYKLNKNQVKYIPAGALGVDLNCDSIAALMVKMAKGKPSVMKHMQEFYDPAWNKEQKRAWIAKQVGLLVHWAKENGCILVLEYLDFEGAKRWLKTKLGKMLRIMPYRSIRKKFERECKLQGVALRYVKSAHTSILGAILNENLGRDVAAAEIIALRGLACGNQWLESKCEALLKADEVQLRINRKRKFGHTVRLVTPAIGIQREQPTGSHYWQIAMGRAINGLSKELDKEYFDCRRQKKPLSLSKCWKWLPGETGKSEEGKRRTELHGTWRSAEMVTTQGRSTPCSTLSR